MNKIAIIIFFALVNFLIINILFWLYVGIMVVTTLGTTRYGNPISFFFLMLSIYSLLIYLQSFLYSKICKNSSDKNELIKKCSIIASGVLFVITLVIGVMFQI